MFNKLFLFLVFFAMMTFASCKKNGDDSLITIPTTARLNVVNATPDTLNYYLNGTRVNNTSSLYPLGTTGYLAAAIGENNYQFRKYQNSNVLFGLPLALDSGRVYSLFVSGEAAENAFLTADTLIADTPARRPRVRFVNASPGSAPLDVMVGDTVNFKVRAYKSVSVFLPVNAGNKRVRIFLSGQSTPILDERRLMNADRDYTIFSKGTPGGTGNNAFGTGIVTNR